MAGQILPTNMRPRDIVPTSINWGMLPFSIPAGDLPFKNGDYLFVPAIRQAIIDKTEEIQAYVVKDGQMQPFTLRTFGALDR